MSASDEQRISFKFCLWNKYSGVIKVEDVTEGLCDRVIRL